MQKDLSKRLLSAVLGWSVEEIEKYSQLIGNLAELKYDEYQQYKPGSRFVEHLCAWLNQFDKGAERNIAFHFLLKNLVFISISEMHRLIETAYYECILPLFKDDAAVFCKESGMEGCEQRITELIKTKALFLAMSDGARIDVLRRIARLDHEQVFVTYDLPEQKFTKIIAEANKRVAKKETDAEVINKLPGGFGHIFLLDDFSGSGISYFRKENNKWHGKVNKVLDILEKEKIIGSDSDNKVKLHVILYLATPKAKEKIKSEISRFYAKRKYTVIIDVQCVQAINQVTLNEDEEELFVKYYARVKNEIEDSHYKKGNMDFPHHGFDNCGLALVLYHNTPNNTFPIIWAGENALFRRVTRHKDVK